MQLDEENLPRGIAQAKNEASKIVKPAHVHRTGRPVLMDVNSNRNGTSARRTRLRSTISSPFVTRPKEVGVGGWRSGEVEARRFEKEPMRPLKETTRLEKGAKRSAKEAKRPLKGHLQEPAARAEDSGNGAYFLDRKRGEGGRFGYAVEGEQREAGEVREVGEIGEVGEVREAGEEREQKEQRDLRGAKEERETGEAKEHKEHRLSLKRQAPEPELVQSTGSSKKLKVEPQYSWDDLDAEDADDPLMVSEYVGEIFGYLHELELRTLPDPNYLEWQRNLRPKMRSILVDWMVEVHLKFRLLPETLYLSINIMDRFMSREMVQVDRLQLLATGSLFIAAKYEEVYSPSVKNYAYVTDGGFSEDEILQAERFILEILNFDMSYPNPMNFLRRISKADDYDVQARTIGKYLLEITAIDHKFIGYLPSLCAASAMYISRKMLGKFDWNGNLIHYSGGYGESDMRETCEMIVDYLVGPIVHEEFFKKYASRRFMKVSILARQWAKKLVRQGKDIMDAVV